MSKRQQRYVPTAADIDRIGDVDADFRVGKFFVTLGRAESLERQAAVYLRHGKKVPAELQARLDELLTQADEQGIEAVWD